MTNRPGIMIAMIAAVAVLTSTMNSKPAPLFVWNASESVPIGLYSVQPPDGLMVTTLAPCWYCSGLIVQFRIGKVLVGESRTFCGGINWLRERGVAVIDLDSSDCMNLLTAFIEAHPAVWHEDIGEE